MLSSDSFSSKTSNTEEKAATHKADSRADSLTEEIGGHDYDFVEMPPDRLVCKICHFPSRDPYLSVCCGHAYCN